MKIFAKVDAFGEYKTLNIASAVYGFRSLGYEIEKFTDVRDIRDSVFREDIVLDGIYQVNYILEKFNVHPSEFNYPQCFNQFLGRRIWSDTINSIYNDSTKWGIFVKPSKEKVFTGKVINSLSDLIGCGSSTEDYEVICSDIVDFISEYRVFILYDRVLGIRHYKGECRVFPNTSILDEMIEISIQSWSDRPNAYSLDLGVTSDGRTLLVEINDSYALGNYGLDSVKYAKLISARWAQLQDVPDKLQLLSD